jgi:hypothetical protein
MPTIVDRLFVESNTEIARKVNQEKDAMSRELPGIFHRIYNHGIGSNIQYLRRYGVRGLKAGMQHDMDDIRHALGRPGKRKIETLGELIKIRRMRKVS